MSERRIPAPHTPQSAPVSEMGAKELRELADYLDRIVDAGLPLTSATVNVAGMDVGVGGGFTQGEQFGPVVYLLPKPRP